MTLLAKSVLHKAMLDLLGRFSAKDMESKPKFQAVKRKWLRLRACVFLTTDNTLLEFWALHAGVQPQTIQRIAKRIYDGHATEEELGWVLSFLRPDAHVNGGTTPLGVVGEAEAEAEAESAAAGF